MRSLADLLESTLAEDLGYLLRCLDSKAALADVTLDLVVRRFEVVLGGLRTRSYDDALHELSHYWLAHASTTDGQERAIVEAVLRMLRSQVDPLNPGQRAMRARTEAARLGQQPMNLATWWGTLPREEAPFDQLWRLAHDGFSAAAVCAACIHKSAELRRPRTHIGRLASSVRGTVRASFFTLTARGAWGVDAGMRRDLKRAKPGSTLWVAIRESLRLATLTAFVCTRVALRARAAAASKSEQAHVDDFLDGLLADLDTAKRARAHAEEQRDRAIGKSLADEARAEALAARERTEATTPLVELLALPLPDSRMACVQGTGNHSSMWDTRVSSTRSIPDTDARRLFEAALRHPAVRTIRLGHYDGGDIPPAQPPRFRLDPPEPGTGHLSGRFEGRGKKHNWQRVTFKVVNDFEQGAWKYLSAL